MATTFVSLCLVCFWRFFRRRAAEAEAAGENQSVSVQCAAAVQLARAGAHGVFEIDHFVHGQILLERIGAHDRLQALAVAQAQHALDSSAAAGRRRDAVSWRSGASR